MKKKTPLLLVLMVIAAGFAALANALQVGQTILSWNWLVAFEYYPSPLYSIFKGTLFFLLFAVSGFGLVARSRWAPGVAAVTTAAAFLWSWVDRLWINRAPSTTGNQLFLIVASLIVLSIVEFSIYLLAPYMKSGSSSSIEGGHNE